MSREAAATLLLAALLVGCAGVQPPPRPARPVPDVIIANGEGETLSREGLLERMGAAEVVYLGEKHDNPHHHTHQLWILEALVQAGHRPAVGFEVFDISQTAALMDHVQSSSTKTHGAGDPDPATRRLRQRLGWGEQREQSWSFYGPLLGVARERGLSVFGIDLPLPLRARVSRVGDRGLSANERSLLPHPGQSDPGYRKVMLERLKAAHCGHGSDAYLGRLFENWILRNETMAGAIVTALEGSSGTPVVVILGAGHTLGGQGVARRVARKRPATRQLNLAFRELRDASPEPSAALASGAGGTGAEHGLRQPPDHDVSWFTPAAGPSREEACRHFADSPGASKG